MRFRYIFIFILAFLFLTGCTKNEEKNMEKIRLPQADNKFYPGETAELKKTIEDYLLQLPSSKTEGYIKAVMVPHAGYVFSGVVAAHAYKLLEGKSYDRIILICNSHSSYFNGIAVDNSDVWRTPLGDVGVDKEFIENISKEENININGEPFLTSDQTIETQLPFLQVVLKPDFKIVPILFGNTKDDSYKNLAQALEKNLGENDLVVVSTDMSHYPKYEDANLIDKKTLEIINTGSVEDLEKHIKEINQRNIPNEETLICGEDGVKTVMKLKEDLELQSEILDYKNSGDSLYGDKESVVGYGSVAFTQIKDKKSKINNEISNKELNKNQKNQLLSITKKTVEEYVKNGKVLDFTVSDERLNWKEGAFVTLHKDGNLRGCIGQIIPSEDPLWQVVRDMAIEAATDDPRFSPVSEDELKKLDYEVSVLSTPKKIDDWKKIELGKHGVIVKRGYSSGVFLPQVADETGWNLEKFLSELCSQKAGLSSDCYKNDKDVELYIFSAQVF